METKFLSDGRKVSIIGQLNNTEWIVQEVFVNSNGDEIPSGERFTTKNLHDQPLETYKNKKEKELDSVIKILSERKEKIEKEIKDLSEHRKTYALLLKSTKGFYEILKENINKGAFNHMCDILSGNIKWAVEVSTYGISEPRTFEDSAEYSDNYYGRLECVGLKLMTLYGKSEGNISYKVHQYSDGGTEKEYLFFKTDKELANYYTKKINEIFEDEKAKKYLRIKDCEIVNKYGGKVKKEIYESLLKKYEEEHKSSINNKQNEISKIEKEFEEIKNKILNK